MTVERLGSKSQVEEAGAVAARLRALLLDPSGGESLLSELAGWAAGQVEDAVSCGITVSAAARASWIGASSDELAKRMDGIQYVLEDGPCLSCIRERVVVRIADVGSDRRWLEFAVRGQREGVASSLSVPMIVGSRLLGAVNLYSSRPDGLHDANFDLAQVVAHQAGGAVAFAVRQAEREHSVRQVEDAPDPQSVTDRAVGIIMAREHITAEAAFDILRTQSYHSHTQLPERARAVIAEIAAPPPPQ